MAEWKWRGGAGHFICADDCLYHLHTDIGEYCISTVGDWRPIKTKWTGIHFSSFERGPAEEIGADRLYETMVFRLNPDDTITDYGELDFAAYNTREEADAGHLAMCQKWAGTADQP